MMRLFEFWILGCIFGASMVTAIFARTTAKHARAEADLIRKQRAERERDSLILKGLAS